MCYYKPTIGLFVETYTQLIYCISEKIESLKAFSFYYISKLLVSNLNK